MKKQINYITIDGRGDHETFKDCITKAIKELKSNEGIHVIKDFEPFPMYKMMDGKGFDKHVEKLSDEEFHVYFTPKEKIEKIQMEDNLEMDHDKIKKIMEIKLKYLRGEISLELAKEFLLNLSPKFSKLKNPVLFKTMASIATLDMISERGGFEVEELISKITEEINSRN